MLQSPPVLAKVQPHQRRKHQKEFSCEDCGKKFLRKDQLTDHLPFHKEPSLKCQYCGKLFKFRKSLAVHLRLHTPGGKMFQCPLCDRRFTQKANLQKHQATHNKKKVRCPKCHKNLSSMEYLKKHLRNHKEVFPCSLCHQIFSKYDPETKRQSSQWIERGEPKPKKAIFTKCKVYLGIMRRLMEAVRLKRPERWQNNDWRLHVDNARPHTAHVVLQFLAKHSAIQIPHPPYSPDLAPNDFFLYLKLKMKLKERKFDNVDMIQAESKATLRNLSKSDFISCFDNWKKR
ncbi:hypothetical protein LAZ67_12000754 [Cordylochernes scorpioides]|uniref:C2H2-type domain-containing protein n=1 Tax=Cordylochernes scorpioides TaxID=51811 RepID=A0ABY6L1A4_9ARAC|nr:hypothetical protein LAZ67_12000754 [Cordylochernes scorpioides]